jgi:hypothetical protein
MKIEVGQEYDYNPNLSSSYKRYVEFCKNSPYDAIEFPRGKIEITQIYIENGVTYIRTNWCGETFDLNSFLECIEKE